MKSNKAKDTKPEVETRRLLHRQGLRFRKGYLIRLNRSRTTADIAFPRQRLAVFIDGCFWHSCPQHGSKPTSNAAYWGPKLRGNIERDKEVGQQLASHGWDTLRLWEHLGPEEMARIVAERVAQLREGEG